jgi:hypothetical protein
MLPFLRQALHNFRIAYYCPGCFSIPRGIAGLWVKPPPGSNGWRQLSLNATRSWDLQWCSLLATLYAIKQDSGA